MTASKRTGNAGTIRTGISGWRYEPWRGTFYPKNLRQQDELKYAASHLSTIEINGTFYSLQTPDSFARWAADVPEGFIFAVKGPQFITHMRRLKDVDAALANFFASGILRLGPTLGPILWQLPPNFKFDRERLESFFKLLPRDAEAAGKLARRHDKRLKTRAWTKPLTQTRLRYAMEIRHVTFATPEFVGLLRRHNIALVCADSVEWPRLMDVTSDFIYCRLHGSEELYASGYDDDTLHQWADRAVSWMRGEEPANVDLAGKPSKGKRKKLDVFIYFDNDKKVRAPADSKQLMEFIQQELESK
jgi:uncharacterized protein YecE (DUF72 family)